MPVPGPKVSITIQETTETRDAYGGVTEAWTTFLANISGVLTRPRWRSETEKEAAGKILAYHTHTFYCDVQLQAMTGMITGAVLAIGTTNTAVAHGAFTFCVAGVEYTKVANAVGIAPGNDVIPQNLYGAVALDIGSDSTIHVVEAATNATGYASAVLAVAGLPAVAASHVRMGTITAMSSEVTGFTFGTTALNAANSTVAYNSVATFTASYISVTITEKHRILYGSRVFNILNVYNPGEMNHHLELSLQEIV